MALLEETVESIQPPDAEAERIVAARLDSLTKPLGSLGHLEEIVRRYASIRHDPAAAIGRGTLLVFVADHGVAEEGVSAYPRAVTAQMLRNFAQGGAAICVLARRLDLRLELFDVGVESDTRGLGLEGVKYHRVAPGTRNFLRGSAMTPDQARQALGVGIEAATEAAQSGSTLIGIGEMGIGNSTSATALIAALTGIEASRLAGRGTGLDDRGYQRKLEVVTEALRIHRATFDDPLRALAALGGFEIAAMAGACLGAASVKVPVVVDGFIAAAAAVTAERLAPGLYRNMFFGHQSSEGGHGLVLNHLGLRPILTLDMRLGEGTGAALAMGVIESALRLFHEMATFAGAGVSEKLK